MGRGATFLGGIALSVALAVRPWPATVAQEREIKDCAECPAMVVVPAGRIMRTDKFGAAEFPVEFRRPFAMSKYEVTWAEFAVFAKATGLQAKGCA
jgi:formylglycine-generating enzyme required for sulfatase activity